MNKTVLLCLLALPLSSYPISYAMHSPSLVESSKGEKEKSPQREQVQPADSTKHLEELVVLSRQMLGSKFEAANRTGSSYYLSPLELEKLNVGDINRMLRSVPGVNLYEEDGFGLRPNISLRGTKAERSERITLMEDGILAAPAPYSAPAAYYFPNAARMSAVEVLKGSSQVQYGPFTTGGAINLVSTPIPDHLSGKASLSYGTFNTLKLHTHLGNRHKNFSYLVEYLRYQSDGFKPNELADRKGFVRNDLIAKLRFETDRSKSAHHALELKYGYADERSDETYVGLTEADFARNPYQRYAGSQMDNMSTKHHQLSATYLLRLSRFKLLASAYHNYFHRNWYKLNDIKAGTTSQEKRSIGQTLEDPETNHLYYEILTGQRDYLGSGLIVRANNRTYYSSGVQVKGERRFAFDGHYLTVEMGLRLHQDREDRFQWDDGYQMIGGRMSLFVPSEHGSQANRITSAEALSSYILGKWSWQRMTMTAGLRYEDVVLHKKDYTTKDLRRSGHLRIEDSNHVRALIPSIGLNYKFVHGLSAFAGVHKGFAPPGSGYGQKAESSINTELGIRYHRSDFRGELIGFYNRYSNMLGSDLAASGGTGTLDQFAVGEARVWGAEALLSGGLSLGRGWRVPLQVSYTYTGTEMLSDFESTAWGQVFSGDEIPYIFRHALHVQVGIEHKWIDCTLGVRYNGDMRTTPGQGAIPLRELIPSHWIVDASARVHLLKGLSLQFNAVNLLDRSYLSSRHPAGLRAGHPRGLYVGAAYKL